jgi:hypothetical protein
MWFWLFAGIAVLGALWHFSILVSLARKGKKAVAASADLRQQLETLANLVGRKPELTRPTLAIDTPIDEVLLRRYRMMRRRRERKALRERRLIDRLNRIDPTERRFTRAKRS